MKTFQEFISLCEKKKYDDRSYGFDRSNHDDLEVDYDGPRDVKNSHPDILGYTSIKHKKTGITYEISHKKPENEDEYAKTAPHSHLSGKSKTTHGHKPVHDIRWDHDKQNPSPSEKIKIARDAKRMWDNDIKHRIPSGHLASNEPSTNSDPSRRNPDKNTRGSIYKKAGFGEVGENSGKQYSAKIGKIFHPVHSEEYNLEESSSGERAPRGSTGSRTGRALTKMHRRDRTDASIARKAGIRGTGKLSTKDLETPTNNYTTNPNWIRHGDAEVDHYVTTYASPRKYASHNLIDKSQPRLGGPGSGSRVKSAPSSKSVPKVREFARQISRSGASKTGKVHQVDIMHRNKSFRKDDPYKQMERGRSFIKAIKDTPKHLKKAGAKKREAIVGEPTAVMSGEDNKTGEEKRAKLYKKLFKRSSDRSHRTGLMVGPSVVEKYNLEESSSGERAPRGSTGNRTGRALTQMTKKERTAAAIARKAGLKGTGKLSTKDLRTPIRDYTNGDGSVNDGSTKVDHYINTHSSPRRFAVHNLVSKRKIKGYKGKVVPSAKSVLRVKDFARNLTKAGVSKTGRVHTVDIMHRDEDIEKGDKYKQVERGRRFINAIKDTPRQLKKAGVKPGEGVIGKPTSVMPGENKKTGEAKRAKLYKKIFGNKSSEKSEKTGLMVGRA